MVSLCKKFFKCFNYKSQRSGKERKYNCKNWNKCKGKELFHFCGICTKEDINAYKGPLWLIADSTDHSFEFLQFCFDRCNDSKRKKYIQSVINRKKKLEKKEKI